MWYFYLFTHFYLFLRLHFTSYPMWPRVFNVLTTKCIILQLCVECRQTGWMITLSRCTVCISCLSKIEKSCWLFFFLSQLLLFVGFAYFSMLPAASYCENNLIFATWPPHRWVISFLWWEAGLIYFPNTTTHEEIWNKQTEGGDLDLYETCIPANIQGASFNRGFVGQYCI